MRLLSGSHILREVRNTQASPAAHNRSTNVRYGSVRHAGWSMEVAASPSSSSRTIRQTPPAAIQRLSAESPCPEPRPPINDSRGFNLGLAIWEIMNSPPPSTTTSPLSTPCQRSIPGPPLHSCPLYNCVPLPDMTEEHMSFHGTTGYIADSSDLHYDEWHMPRPSSPDHHHEYSDWIVPATNPKCRSLKILVSQNISPIIVFPSTYDSPDVVTVADVLKAIEIVVTMVETGFPTEPVMPMLKGHQRRESGSCGVCRGEIDAVEQLRRRYRRAGLYDNWIIQAE